MSSKHTDELWPVPKYHNCERCGHVFLTHGCPKCDRRPTAADHAALIAKIKQAAERAHAEWCAGPEGKLENVRAISKAFDEVFSLCDEVCNG